MASRNETGEATVLKKTAQAVPPADERTTKTTTPRVIHRWA
jgi:hypothetical protein